MPILGVEVFYREAYATGRDIAQILFQAWPAYIFIRR